MGANTITRSRLRELADVRPEHGRVLSVFMNLDPTEFAIPGARASAITSVITAAAHKVDETEGLDHDEVVTLRQDVERVKEVLSSSDIAQNGTRAVAVYACGTIDLLEVVALHRPTESRVCLDRTAHVAPLVAESDRERWCVLLANRRCARLFVGDDAGFEETDRIEDAVHRQHDQGGWSQSRFQRGIDKEKDDHLVHTAEVAFELYRSRGFDRLLVGAPEELRSDLESKLHPYLRDRIVGHVQTDVEHSNVDAVRMAADEAITAHIRRCEGEALDRLAEGVGRGGRGAAGLGPVLTALNDQRVEILLLADGFSASGLRDAETGMLAPEGQENGTVFGTERLQDIVEPAIEKAIDQDAKVIRVRHHDDLGPLGGIGAVLRY
jgi:peptide subunit release factor 1 (eRF1)